jgi:hypothetical protein
MADVAISYSHLDRELALEVRRTFINEGFSTWMDDAGEDNQEVDAVGIPVGQEHWSVITTEFAAANVVVVVGTPNWDNSEYCRKEYEFCVGHGKWVERLQSTDVSEVADQLLKRESYVAAHARTVSRTLSAEAHTPISLWERISLRREASDAELIFSENPEDYGVELTAEIKEYAAAVLERRQKLRRRINQVGVTGMAALLVLALISGAAWWFASVAEESAAASAARAQSLQHAREAGSVTDTLAGLSMARAATDLSSNELTEQAVALAEARDKRLRVIDLEPREYRGGAWAADVDITVVYTAQELFRVDVATGEIGPRIEIPGGIVASSLVVSANGSHAALVDRDRHTLVQVALEDGVITQLTSPGVTTASTGDGYSLWWATIEGYVVAAPFPVVGGALKETAVKVPHVAGAISVSVVDGLLDTVGQDGVARTFRMRPGELREITKTVITNDWTLDAVGGYSTTIQRCGPMVYGSLIKSFTQGKHFSWNANANGNDTSPNVVRSTQISPPLCGWNGNAWSVSTVRGLPKSFSGGEAPVLPPGGIPYYAVQDPLDSRTAVVSGGGRLLVLNEKSALRSAAFVGAEALLPMDEATLIVTAEGAILDANTGAKVGDFPGTPLGASAAVSGCSGLLEAGRRAVYRVACDGSVHEVLAHGPLEFQAIRAASDGKHFVISLTDELVRVDLSGRVVGRDRQEWVPTDDAINDADLSPDGANYVVSTVLGHVRTQPVGKAGGGFDIGESVPASNLTRVAFAPKTGNIFLLSADGILRSFDAALKPLRTARIGFSADSLQFGGDRAYLGASGSDYGESLIVDADTLAAVERVEVGGLVVPPDADDARTLYGLPQFLPASDGSRTLYWMPPLEW